MKHKQLHEYVGVIHIHSTYSDGSRTIPEIAAIARDVELDFLLMTDHNTLQPKRDGLEGWYNGVLVGIGYEINDANDLNHYLAFNMENEAPDTVHPEVYVEQVKKAGGFGIIAHPDEKRKAIKEFPPYPWNLWDSPDFDGIEIWNQMSEWMEGLTHFNKYWRAVNPRRTVISPMRETLEKWDRVRTKRKVVGVGGVDAHGHIYKLWGLFKVIIFRYKILFKSIRTHILTDTALMPSENHEEDLQNLYRNLLDCRAFISNFYCGDARGFRFRAENSRETAEIGGELKLDDQTHFHISIPQTATTKLFRNGIHLASQKGRDLVFEVTEKGIYRVEVYYFDRPWIFSNHISIT